MKRATTMLGALALAATGFLFAAPAAHAQAPLDTISNGGVTCKQYSTVHDWQTAATDTFWDCINTGSSPTFQEKLVPSQAKNLPAAMKNTLADVELLIFQNRNDFASFTGVAAPAAKYMEWTAPAGPAMTNLSGKRIAAVFAEANLYRTTDHVVATRNLIDAYKFSALQALGRHYDQLTGNPSQFGGNPIHLFPIAVEYDKWWTNHNQDGTATTVTDIWDAYISALYPNDTPWDVLGELYGNSEADLFAMQFAEQYGSPWSHLHQFMNAYAENTEAFRSQQIFGLGVVREVKGAYGAGGARNVLCVEHVVGGFNPPATLIWDCVHPYNYTAGEHQAGQGISGFPQAFRDYLNAYNPDLELYVMFNSQDYNTMFATALPTSGLLGYSNNQSNRAAAFYSTGTDLSSGHVYNYYNGTLVHEVAHMLDVKNWNTYSALPAWNTIIQNDVVQFNNLNCMSALNDATACGNGAEYVGKSNWDRFLTRLGHYPGPNPTPAQEDALNKEIFAWMVQKKASTTSGSSTFSFLQYVENQLWGLATPNMKNKIEDIWSNGHP